MDEIKIYLPKHFKTYLKDRHNKKCALYERQVSIYLSLAHIWVEENDIEYEDLSWGKIQEFYKFLDSYYSSASAKAKAVRCLKNTI